MKPRLGRLVLLTFIDYEGRCDYVERFDEGRVWSFSAVRTRPVYVENPTAKYHRELDEMKRFNQETQRKAGKWIPSEDPLLARYPNLDQYLTDAWWEDGKPREVCSITVRAGKQQATVSLNDADGEQSISTSGESIEDALGRLEAYLAAGNPTWRPWGRKKRN